MKRLIAAVLLLLLTIAVYYVSAECVEDYTEKYSSEIKKSISLQSDGKLEESKEIIEKLNKNIEKENLKLLPFVNKSSLDTISEEIRKLNGYNQKDDKTLFLSVAHKCLYNIDELKKDFKLNPEIFF